MKRDMTFPVLVFCIAVLTFSLLFATYAQQNSGRVAAKTVAAQDTSAMRFEAKFAAGQDVNRYINERLRLGADVGTLCIGGAIGGLAGCVIGNFIAPRDPSAPSGLMPFDDISQGAVVGGCIGFAAGVLVPLSGIYRSQSHPPPERLLGKSPEYVEIYADAYKAKTR